MKYLSILKYALLAISALVVILFFVSGDINNENNPMLALMLDWAYILLGVAVVAAVLFPLVHIIQNPKGALQTLIGLAIVVVVVGISYAIASDAPITTAVITFDNPATLKLSDMGLYTTYAALTVAILAIIVGEIGRVFKK